LQAQRVLSFNQHADYQVFIVHKANDSKAGELQDNQDSSDTLTFIATRNISKYL